MTFLPIVERELRVRARLGATYHGRWIAVLVAFLISVPFLLMSSPGRGGSGDGQTLFYVFTTLAFLYSLFGGARLTSDSLSSEKRDGTLGLLFLTHLKGYDVVLGKLVSNSLSSFYGLLAVMPVFGLALLMGGVTGGEFWRVTLVLINTLFFSLAVGLWVSARSRDEQKIMVGTNLLLIAIAGGFPLIDFLILRSSIDAPELSLLSPGTGCFQAFDYEYKSSAAGYWISLLLVHGLGWTFLALAARAALRYREDDLSRELTAPASRQTKILGRWVPSIFARPSRRLALASINPVYWLAQLQSGQKALIWSLTGLRLGVTALNIYLILMLRGSTVTIVGSSFRTIFLQIISLIFWYAVAMVSCRFFAQARRDGTLELLFSTPLTDRTILDGLRLHLKNLLMAPVICIILAQLANTLVIMSIANNSSITAWYFVVMLVSVVSFCVEAMAFCYVGMWLSASMKRPALAAPITFALLALVPLLFCSSLPTALIYAFLARYGRATGISWISLFSPILLIFVWLILIRWARGRLHRGVRAVILHQPIPISIRP